MSLPLLATKLYVPPPRPQVIHRSRLLERLSAGLPGKLTLISAPAGFGKTTLLGDWVVGCERPVAWLSLDAADRDLNRFLTYLVAALQTAVPAFGSGLARALRSAPPPPAEAVLSALVNELAAVAPPLVLVLDDYHVVDAAEVDAALAFLLEQQPPQLHLVVTTREDPNLPLARLRARAQLTELRAADLRFTAAEAAAFLGEVMGLTLTPADTAALEERTEGWIAGLQLAALSMHGRQDVSGFIRAFAGEHRYIVDYLVDEVLARQSAAVRDFLLQTSLLERLSGPLCEAVTGQAGGAARLEALHHANLFLVPLDDTRQWYRYHHLFAAVLAAHLRAEQPAQIAVLHGRASVWFEQHGAAADAIRHALAAEDMPRAADLIERAADGMRRLRQDATLLGWLRALPDAIIRCRPVLGTLYAHVLLAGGVLTGVEDRLGDAARWLDQAPGHHSAETEGEMVVVDETAFRRLPAQIALARAALALGRGDVAASEAHARSVFPLAAADDHTSRGGAAGFLGLAAWRRGDLDEAYRAFAAGLADLQRAGNIADTVGGATTLAAIRIAQGRLHAAQRTYEQGLAVATAQQRDGSDLVLRGAADMHVGLSEIAYERNELATARQHLQRSTELGEHLGFPPHPYRRRVALARLHQAEGDLAGALALLDEAERRYMADFAPDVRPVAALRTRLWLAQGELDAARDWVGARGLSTADALSYVREFEHLTLARVLIAGATRERADGAIDAALGLLQRLRDAAEAGTRTGSMLEILIVEALAYEARGNTPAALSALHRALTLAEPEGYVRVFVDEGRPIATLLRAAAAREVVPNYARKLLDACDAAQTRSVGAAPLPAVAPAQPLIEPLSARELDVLRLFATELSGPEIAAQLMIAVSTLRSHTKSIFRKLDVTSRRAAVSRATMLRLI